MKRPWKYFVLAPFVAIISFVITRIIVQFFDLESKAMMDFTDPVTIAIAIIIGPALEELIFRKGLLNLLLKKIHQFWFANILVALLFGILHLTSSQAIVTKIQTMLSVFVISLVFGCAYRDKGYWFATSVHAVTNLIMISLGYSLTVNDWFPKFF